MTETADQSLMLELLKKMHTRFDNVEREIIGLKLAVHASNDIMASFMRNDVRREGDVLTLEQRVARIEHRLDLHDGE